MREKITVIGSLNYDIVLKIPRLPECGETLPADSAVFSPGGKGANQAVQAAKLGVPVQMVGCVGDDGHGQILLEAARRYGVDTEHVRRCKEPTGMGIINAMEDGSVFACIVRGANFAVKKEDIDQAKEILKDTFLAVLQMEIPQEINCYAIEKAKEWGCKVLLNAAPAEEIPLDYLKMCDIIVLNEVEAGFYLKTDVKNEKDARKGAALLAETCGSDIIITLGKTGAVVSEGGKVTFIPSRKVEAIETTGAGDSFIGGVGYALKSGKSLTDACRFATCCSAVTVCRMGAQDAMPFLEEVMELEKQR
ncbi:MAG: ribokinase [Lachnospiraceae bacterium]|nr:ribokinase [Lachnospiraceae bacterium]MCI9059466.1 ribokinase [Lachnospiraceae bacterium]